MFGYCLYNKVRAISIEEYIPSCRLATIVLPYNLQSRYYIQLPNAGIYDAYYSKEGTGLYSGIGTETNGSTVACSTENEKVTLEFVECKNGSSER